MQYSLRYLSIALLTSAILAAPMIARAQTLMENFDDITTLAGKGFLFVNNSFPAANGTDGDWFQGNPSTFVSQSGASDSYIGVNYQSTGGTDESGDTISNWMLTPTVSLADGGTVSFYTRTSDGFFPDRLQVYLSLNGSSSNVGSTATSTGDFSSLLLTVNSDLLQSGPSSYPTDWTKYSIALTGLPAGVSTGRIGFRYYVTDSGSGGTNGDYIGIDTLAITGTPTTAPEPNALDLLSFVGVGSLAAGRKRRRQG